MILSHGLMLKAHLSEPFGGNLDSWVFPYKEVVELQSFYFQSLYVKP